MDWDYFNARQGLRELETGLQQLLSETHALYQRIEGMQRVEPETASELIWSKDTIVEQFDQLALLVQELDNRWDEMLEPDEEDSDEGEA